MTLFVISDTHIGHANIRTYCPWRQTWSNSIGHHDARILSAWQETVSADDLIIHVGDFMFGSKEQIAATRARLPGNVVLVVGNHDRSVTAMMQLGFTACKNHEFNYAGMWFVCRHDPKDFTPDEIERATWLLHGHWHGDDHRHQEGVRPEARPKLIDCGIDALKSVAPMRIEDVLQQRLAQRV